MTALLAVTIPGDPVGKARPRVAVIAGHARAYTPKRTATWEGNAAAALALAWGREPLDEPLTVTVYAVGARPKGQIPSPRKLAADPSLGRRLWRTTKPDGDNVLKCVGDALVDAGVLRDDARIVDWRCFSLVAALDEGPSVRIVLDRPFFAPPEAR